MKNGWMRRCFAVLGLGVLGLTGTLFGCSSAPSEDVTHASQALTAPAWQAGKAYKVGDLVSYLGKLYRAVQAHTAQVGWEPQAVPALWSFEGQDTGSNTPPPGPSGPNGPLTFDYVTLQADCDARPETCCAKGSTLVSLSSGSDTRTINTTNQCTLALGGSDTIHLTSNGTSSLNLGSGDDIAMDGAGDDFIWGGLGNDTINGYGGTNLFFGGFGDDTITAANGTNTVVPGPGRDTVSLGTGNDTVHIFDLCEVQGGETLDGGSGFNTLYSPVPLADLQARGVTVANFQRVIVQDDHCRSQCANHAGCTYCGDDDDHDGTLNCSDGCPLDPNKVAPGICGCSQLELDPDNDGVPTCIDECPNDAKNTYRGECGCAGDPNVAPAGKPCNDGFAVGQFTCNGAGTCGNPLDAAPEPGCIPKTLDDHVYWFCPARPEATALSRCKAAPGRRLVEIDSRQENAFAAKFSSSASWIGAVDRTTEGEWSWLSETGQEAKKFWTGGGSGKPFKGLYQSWSGGNPGSDDAKDCATVSADGAWRSDSCTASHPYVCEGTFGPSRNPGNGAHHTRVGPESIIPGWRTSSNGSGGSGGGGGSGGTDCEPQPTDEDAQLALQLQQKAQVDACNAKCAPGSTASPADCDAACLGEVSKPPPGSTVCAPILAPLSQLDMIVPGSCSVAAPDCSAVKIQNQPTICGLKTRCLDVKKGADNVWQAAACATGADCPSTDYCDAQLKKCVNPALKDACDPSTTDPGACKGECFSDVGCGTVPVFTPPMNDNDQAFCSESRICDVPYTAQLNTPGSLDPVSFDGSALPDHSSDPPPDYSTDFASPCVEACVFCTADQFNTDPDCSRLVRHSWCSYDTKAPGDPTAGVQDDRQGERGNNDSSVIKFAVDPDAELNFHMTPLPFGVSRFDLEAAAAVRATASFNLGIASGSVEIVDVRAELDASLCRVTTKNSRLEVLGVDFLPAIAGDSGAFFDTDEKWPQAAACEKAVNTYVDVVDRAKKALRDAEELVTQYNDLKAHHRTFGPDFCTTIAGPGMRPPFFEGSCGSETPEQTINQFIKFYEHEVGQIQVALNTLSQTVINSAQLSQLLHTNPQSGFDFFAPIGDPSSGLGGNQTTTIIAMQFFIGPVPCLLEVESYVNYGIIGGFGANLRPAALVSGGGKFASAGAVVTPHADAGVTLFVGAGFDIGGFSIRVGIAGGVNLGSVELPATTTAGLSMVPEGDTRPLSKDITDLSNGQLLFPRDGGGLQKYNFQFDYSYGVDLTVADMLDGSIDAQLKIKFLFFSKKWSKRIISFDSGLQIGPLNLIGGGSYNQATHEHADPVAQDTKTWKSSYGSVPFMDLRPLDAPKPEELPLTANASFSNTRATKLFYDSECTCVAGGASCNRDDDCCDDSFSCFSDPAAGGHAVCSACRSIDAHQTCNKDSDCCNGGVCNKLPYDTNCHPVNPAGGCSGLNCIDTGDQCDTVTPQFNVCHTPGTTTDPPR